MYVHVDFVRTYPPDADRVTVTWESIANALRERSFITSYRNPGFQTYPLPPTPYIINSVIISLWPTPLPLLLISLIKHGIISLRHKFVIIARTYLPTPVYDVINERSLTNIEIELFWRPGLIQKHAQSTGNHTAHMLEKNLDQKFGFKKKLEHFFENKNPETFVISKISTKSHWKSLGVSHLDQ